MKNMKKNGGFTLVELIVVIAILAILAAVAIPAYSGYIEKAEKAGDETLIGAINQAFASACVDSGFTQYEVKSATIPVDTNGKVGATSFATAASESVGVPKFVSAVTFTSGSALSETQLIAFNKAFALFFSGNENATFKVYRVLVFDPMTGTFSGQEISEAYQAAFEAIMNNPELAGSIDAFKGSALAQIGADALLGQVSDVSTLAALLIQSVDEDGNPSALTSIVMSESYRETMAGLLGYEDGDAYFEAVQDMMEENPQKAAEFMANSTVLNVANTMNGWDAAKEQEAKNGLINLSYGDMVAKINNPAQAEDGLAQAALLYGMYTAFDPVGASELLKGEDAGLSSLQNLGSKTNADGMTFEQYLAGLTDSSSQASKDYEGYKGALNVVNQGVSSDEAVANKVMNGGYNDSELSALLQQVIGN